MPKKNKNLIWIVLIVIAFFAFQNGSFLGAITGNEVMTRTVPASTGTGQSFQITYTVTGGSGNWGASIEDTVSGGCTFPSGTDYKDVMISDAGNTRSVTINAPATGTCIFSGDYKFGELPIVPFPTASVQVCTPACVRPANLCIESSSVSDGCGGDCTGQWNVVKRTSADIDCDDVIDRTELGTAISGWLGGTFSRNDLGTAIQSWAAGG